MPKPIHIAHMIHRFDIGGLENGIVNLINTLPEGDYQHSIVCLSGFNPDFATRITTKNYQLFDLKKRPGNDFWLHIRLWKLLRKLRPDTFHSRGIAALECQLAALLAGVRRRIHGEHGWDSANFTANKKHLWLRRITRPLIHEYIALSKEGSGFLTTLIGVNPARVNLICNGVNTQLFQPAAARKKLPVEHWNAGPQLIFGCVGRMADVKNHSLLAEAFIELCRIRPEQAPRLRLVIIGDGIHHKSVTARLAEAGLSKQAWLPGALDDLHDLIPAFDLFVLPSLAEGISNTLLEAMACGLPLIATDVGGNSELVEPGVTGTLVPSNVPLAMAQAMATYVDSPELIATESAHSLNRARQQFSIHGMTDKYAALYRHPNASKGID
ncbi:MAG: sugar transferase (PEP-CTERM/EpsH1 system associated) [Motiliproteus sp.]|jgi:sugar transferase (PEP-CTERM/EpsH1 system associated)